jgi:hypothetical protein
LVVRIVRVSAAATTTTIIMSASGLMLQPPSPSAHFIHEHEQDHYENDVDSTMDVDTPEEIPVKETLKETTTIIFDWDDTLLPSSWLSVKGLRLDYPAQLPQDVLDELETHQESVCAVLIKAMQCGTVVIITNAETGWVELSAQRFMPRVAPLLSQICVFSARSTYEPMYPDNPLQWKVAAFKQLVGQTQPMNIVDTAENLMRSVISFGDSVHERDAVRKVTANLGSTFTKSVKFVERPNLEQLRREVDLVRNCLDYICGCRSDLDLMLTIQLLFA